MDITLYTLQQVAEKLSLSVSTVRRLADAGEVPVIRIGNRTLIRSGDLEALVDRHALSGEGTK